MKKLGIRFFYLFVSILCVVNSKAQDNSGCFTKYQLIKMQSSSLDDIRMFLNNEDWTFNGAKSNQPFKYNDRTIFYNVVSWQKSTYSNGGNITLYSAKGKPSIVVYQCNSSCFNNLLKNFASSKGKTNIDDDKLVTAYIENSIVIEFREVKNNYSNSKYSILVYNSKELNKEVEFQEEDEIEDDSGL